MRTRTGTRTVRNYRWLGWSLAGATTLTASTLLLGCNRSEARGKQTAETAVPAESTATPPASLPQQIADVMVQLNGGIHTGFRFNHAKGIAVSGSFTPTAQAKSLSPAAHFAGPAVPVTVRFSNGPGVPDNLDSDLGWAVGVKRTLGGHYFEILLSNNNATTMDQIVSSTYQGAPLRMGDLQVGFNIERRFGGKGR